MFCPFRMLNKPLQDCLDDYFTWPSCLQEYCAWWIEEDENCAIKTLARTLYKEYPCYEEDAKTHLDEKLRNPR